MRRISQRIGNIEPSATMAITAKAAALKAAGQDVIGFGAGEPDFPTPQHIVEAAIVAARDPVNHHYSAAGGRPEMKRAVAFKTARDSGLEVDPADVVVTNGGKQAVFNSLAALVDQGDEVLVPAPYWVTYPEAVKLAGGSPVIVSTGADFKMTVGQLEAARTERTKALVLASPSNPTGIVYSAQELAQVGEWLAEHEIWAITDEIYEHLVYGTTFASLPVVAPAVRDRCVIVNGVAKTYAMTGWRVGWMIAPTDIAKAASSLMSHSTSNVNNVAQMAAAAALEGPLDAVFAMRGAFDERRLAMHRMLNDMDGIECPEPVGAFYCFPSVAGVLGQAIGGRTVTTSMDLAEALLETAGVAVVPGEAFGAPGHLRLSYALGLDDLQRGLARMGEALG